jgi:hypothetical protein
MTDLPQSQTQMYLLLRSEQLNVLRAFSPRGKHICEGQNQTRPSPIFQSNSFKVGHIPPSILTCSKFT